MNGLLTEEVDQPSVAPTGAPPMAAPEVDPTQTLAPEPGQFATETISEVSDEAAPILDKAVNIAYSEENFQKMVDMFREGGAEGFPKTTGVAVLGVLDNLEGQDQLSDDTIAEVGGAMFEMITEDMIEGGVVQGIDKSHIGAALQETIAMWAKKNPERFNNEEFQQALQETINAEEIAVAGEPSVNEMAPAGLFAGEI